MRRMSSLRVWDAFTFSPVHLRQGVHMQVDGQFSVGWRANTGRNHMQWTFMLQQLCRARPLQESDPRYR